MKRALIAIPALLVGCSEHSMDRPDEQPIEEKQRECTLHSVEILEDQSDVSDGFAAAPEDWIAEMTGSFEGSVETSFGSLAGTLDVDHYIGDVRLVQYTWNDTENLCDAWYEIGFGASLSVGNGQLDELFAATLRVDAGNVTSFVLEIPITEVRGTMRPAQVEDSDARLRIEGDFKQLLWNGDLGWLGEVDDYEAWEDIGAFSFGPG